MDQDINKRPGSRFVNTELQTPGIFFSFWHSTTTTTTSSAFTTTYVYIYKKHPDTPDCWQQFCHNLSHGLMCSVVSPLHGPGHQNGWQLHLHHPHGWAAPYSWPPTLAPSFLSGAASVLLPSPDVHHEITKKLHHSKIRHDIITQQPQEHEHSLNQPLDPSLVTAGHLSTSADIGLVQESREDQTRLERKLTVTQIQKLQCFSNV